MTKTRYFVDGDGQAWYIGSGGRRRRAAVVQCDQCGKPVFRIPSEAKRARASYCSIKCINKGREHHKVAVKTGHTQVLEQIVSLYARAPNYLPGEDVWARLRQASIIAADALGLEWRDVLRVKGIPKKRKS